MLKILLIYENMKVCQKIEEMLVDCILGKVSVEEIESDALQTLADINDFEADYTVLEMGKEMVALVLEEISSHQEYYYDGEHLNRYGAEKFTQYFLENCMG